MNYSVCRSSDFKAFLGELKQYDQNPVDKINLDLFLTLNLNHLQFGYRNPHLGLQSTLASLKNRVTDMSLLERYSRGDTSLEDIPMDVVNLIKPQLSFKDIKRIGACSTRLRQLFRITARDIPPLRPFILTPMPALPILLRTTIWLTPPPLVAAAPVSATPSPDTTKWLRLYPRMPQPLNPLFESKRKTAEYVYETNRPTFSNISANADTFFAEYVIGIVKPSYANVADAAEYICETANPSFANVADAAEYVCETANPTFADITEASQAEYVYETHTPLFSHVIMSAEYVYETESPLVTESDSFTDLAPVETAERSQVIEKPTSKKPWYRSIKTIAMIAGIVLFLPISLPLIVGVTLYRKFKAEKRTQKPAANNPLRFN